MSAIVQRFIRDDLSPERGRRLIEWCIEQGGDEFSFRTISLGNSSASHGKLANALTSFHRGTPKRENMTILAGEEARCLTETWKLTTECAAVLRQHVTDGVFEAPSYSIAGWIENFTIYRRGEVMLGVVSHEGLVILCLTEQEHREFAELRLSHMKLPPDHALQRPRPSRSGCHPYIPRARVVGQDSMKDAIEDTLLVEAANFTHNVKFLAHAMLGSLRYLREISHERGIPMADLQPAQILEDLKREDQRQRAHQMEAAKSMKHSITSLEESPLKRSAKAYAH